MARVAITGASGLLGGNLAAELIAAKHEVVAIRRAGTKVKHLDDLPIEWREAELGDVAAMTKAFAGSEVVFHCAAAVGVIKKVTDEMRAANVTGTTNVIEAALAAKVRRLVHTSSVVTVGITTTGTPSDESASWNFEAEGFLDAYAITKRESEDLVTQARDRIDAVIVNPGYMFGPRDARPSSGKLIVDTVRGRVPGTTPGFNNFVDARDVARGMIAAWHKGRRNERYILVGHDMSYADLFKTIAKVANVKAPAFAVPKPIAWALGKIGDLSELAGVDPLVNSVQIRYAYTDKFRFKSEKAAKELGYTFGPIETAISDAITWFRSNEMLS